MVAVTDVLDRRVVVAPMAGGPTTTALVTAAARSGAAASWPRVTSCRPRSRPRSRRYDAHSAEAPVGYPAIHHLTAPIRAAAAARGDADALNLWAGTAHAAARPGSTAEIVERLRR